MTVNLGCSKRCDCTLQLYWLALTFTWSSWITELINFAYYTHVFQLNMSKLKYLLSYKILIYPGGAGGNGTLSMPCLNMVAPPPMTTKQNNNAY